METLYKVLGKTGESVNGGAGKWPLPRGRPGKWMPILKGIVACQRGYHLCEAKDLPSWLFGGEDRAVFVAEGRGEMLVEDNKVVFSQARLLKRLIYNDKIARLWAADCAEHVLAKYEERYPKDKRPRQAIEATRKFARGEIDDAARSAAESAAESAAWSAARSAAWSAAESAAWSAAWSAARSAARSAAESAAWSAARSAARSAERKWQSERLLQYLMGEVQ